MSKIEEFVIFAPLVTRTNLDEIVFFKCDFYLDFFLIFFSWLLILFKVHYINTRKMFYFSIRDKKKICLSIFLMWDNFFKKYSFKLHYLQYI